jgi:hypothetical protein
MSSFIEWQFRNLRSGKDDFIFQNLKGGVTTNLGAYCENYKAYLLCLNDCENLMRLLCVVSSKLISYFDDRRQLFIIQSGTIASAKILARISGKS